MVRCIDKNLIYALALTFIWNVFAVCLLFVNTNKNKIMSNLGEIWLAAADGSCAHAGTCPPGGVCGDGENILGDCPIWTNVATYPIKYTPGGSVKIGGTTINPGETIRFYRGEIESHRTYTYPVEVFRAPNGNNIPTPPEIIGSGVKIVISNITPNANLQLGNPPCYDPLNPSYTQTYYANFKPMEGAYEFVGYSPGGNTDIWGTYEYSCSGGHITAPVYVAPVYAVWKQSGFNKYLLRNTISGQWQLIADVGVISYYYARYAMNCNISSDSITGVAGWSGDVSFVNYSPGTPIPENILKWKVETFPLPMGVLLPTTNYESIPLEENASEYMLEYGKTSFRDAITLIANPTTAVDGTISVTLRSACENPPP